jgi:hypothetical protein
LVRCARQSPGGRFHRALRGGVDLLRCRQYHGLYGRASSRLDGERDGRSALIVESADDRIAVVSAAALRTPAWDEDRKLDDLRSEFRFPMEAVA